MTILQKHIVFIPLFCVAFIGLFGWIVMMLWNWLLPELFGLPTISFWQSAGLLLLCKILFGGAGCGHHGHGCGHGHGCRCGHGHEDGCDHSSNTLRERWESMTTEERKHIIEMHKGNNTDANPDEK